MGILHGILNALQFRNLVLRDAIKQTIAVI